MAEPARSQYDNDDSPQPIIRPDLQALQGGGQTSPPVGGLHSLPDENGDKGEDDGSDDNAADPSARQEANKRWGMPSGELQNRESGDHDKQDSKAEDTEANQVQKFGGLYRQEALRQFKVSIDRRRAFIGGGIMAGVITVIIALIVSLAPLKLVSIMTDLHDRFFGTSQSAVDKYTQKLFENYVKKYVAPNLATSHCHSTIDSGCIVPVAGEGKLHQLYRAWSENKLEQRMAEHGFVLTYNTNIKKYSLKTPTQEIPDIKGWIDGTESLEDISGGADRAAVRTALRDALKDETLWQRSLDRYRFWRLLETKYHLPHCTVACRAKDSLNNFGASGSRAAKAWIIERVIQPRSELLGLFFECISVKDCTGTSHKVTDDYGNEITVTDYESEFSQRLAALTEKFNAKSVQDILKAAEEFNKKGFTEFVAEKVVTIVFDKESGQVAGKALGQAVDAVAWVNLAAQILSKLHGSQAQIKKFAYLTAAAGTISLFTLYLSHMDEIKSGHVTADVVGSFTNLLGDNPFSLADGSQVSQSAESSPFYDKYINGGSVGNASSYVCTDGSKGPCKDETFAVDKTFVNALGAFSQPPLDWLGGAADFWNGSIGKLFNIAGDILTKTPGVKQSLDAITSKMSQFLIPFFKAAASNIVPFNILDNMTGAQMFTRLAAGADAAGSDFAGSLGGKLLSPQQAYDIQNEQVAEAKLAFEQKPLTYRLFSKDSSKSLVSQVALAIPISKGAAVQNGVASVLNPLSHFGSLLAGPLVSQKAQAAGFGDDFGVPQVGVPLDDPAYNVDPETLTDSYCKDFTAKWEQQTMTDPSTGQEFHTTTNPCLLQEAAITSSGATSDANLVDPSLLSDSGANLPAAPTEIKLAQELTSSPKTAQLAVSFAPKVTSRRCVNTPSKSMITTLSNDYYDAVALAKTSNLFGTKVYEISGA